MATDSLALNKEAVKTLVGAAGENAAAANARGDRQAEQEHRRDMGEFQRMMNAGRGGGWDSPVRDTGERRLTGLEAQEERRKMQADDAIMRAANADIQRDRADVTIEKKEERTEAHSARASQQFSFGSLQESYENKKDRLFSEISSMFGLPTKVIIDIIKVLILIAFVVVIIILMYAYQGPFCKQHMNADREGRSAISLLVSDLMRPAFDWCIVSNTVWKPIKWVFAQLHIDIADFAMGWIEKEVSVASGQYFSFTARDSTPVGVFLDSPALQQSYDIAQPIQMDIKINVKTIGSQVSGFVSCEIDGQPQDFIKSSEGIAGSGDFKTSVSKPFPVSCIFNEGRFDEGQRKAKINVYFKYKTLADADITFMTNSAASNLKNKQWIETKAKPKTLETDSAPMKIGGMLGSGDGKVVVLQDEQVTAGTSKKSNIINLGMTFHADNWESGSVKQVNRLAIVLPKGLSLVNQKDDTEGDSVIACGGYTFDRVQDCISGSSRLKSYFDTYFWDGLCTKDEQAFLLNNSGSNKKIDSIERFTNMNCWPKYDVSQLFQDSSSEGETLGSVERSIKIYATYMFQISKTLDISLVSKVVRPTSFKKQQCSAKIMPAEKKEPILQADVDKYTEKPRLIIQNYVKRASVPGMETVQMEALIAAIAYKYSPGFVPTSITDRNNDGQIDFLTGCRKPRPSSDIETKEYYEGMYSAYSDNMDSDVQCAVEAMKKSLKDNNNNVEMALNDYYNSREYIYGSPVEGTANLRATQEDYYRWISTLCDA